MESLECRNQDSRSNNLSFKKDAKSKRTLDLCLKGPFIIVVVILQRILGGGGHIVYTPKYIRDWLFTVYVCMYLSFFSVLNIF